MKQLITILLITCLFCSPLRAGDSSTLTLEKIYPTNDKMLITWTESKRSVVLVAVKEGNQAVNLTKYFKAGNTYPATYTDNTYTEVMVYDNSGDPHKFKDDVNFRKYEEAKAAQAKKDAEAKAQAEKQAAENAPGEVIGIVLAVTLVVVLLAVIVAIASIPTTST